MDKKSKAMDKFADRSAKIEEQIREQEKKKQERQFLEELGKRISVAREGRMYIEKRDYARAMTAYRRFLAITARSVNVEIEALSPQLIEEKRRVAEALILSSIFFDLLRMLDKLDTPSAAEERRLYHKLFIRFTLGQPFQHFAGENIRRNLIYSNALKHKKEFWATYHAIQTKRFCVVGTWAFGNEAAPELDRLRAWRDDSLVGSVAGRAFVTAYYRYGVGLRNTLHWVPGARWAARTAIRAAVATISRT